jgi:hypothetical protein
VAERKAEAAGQFSLFGGSEQAATEIDESVLEGAEFDQPTLLRLAYAYEQATKKRTSPGFIKTSIPEN